MVYRCPTCPYVNASYHGTLTHCQMKHPDIIARADELQTDVVLVNNMVGCTIGSGFNERGYICKMCPQIFASLRKLKVHHVTDHDGAEPRASERPDHGSHGSELMDLKNNAAVSATEMGFSRDLDTPKTCESSIPYKCHMCSYKAYYRRYLQCHYKNTHKLDAPVTRKLLENYGKYKLNNASQLPGAECEEGATLTCKKCPELMFESTQLLVAHYATCHSSKCIDFTVLSQGSKKGSTGLYRCVHCNKQMNGIRKLWYHLDCHRERDIKRANAAMTTASPVITTTPEAKSVKLGRQDELLMLESVEELSQWNVAPVQTFTLPLSPLSSPSNPADEEQPQLKSREHTCRQCRRTFMSLKGLRSHERSHAAVAAIKKLDNLPTSVLKHDINKYVLYKIGTIKPFLCSFCSYRTTVMGLWRSHFMKTHKDDIADPDETDNQDEQRADKEPLSSSEELNYCIEPEITEKSLYLEPPDVQRQLNHYSFMAQADALTKTNRQESTLPDDCLLHCEFCNFNTGHLSSMRRHYLNRHGKKIFRCKDCSFFSGLRKTLEMHMKTGHSTCQSEPSHQKDLRCPFCLYQTKNKNNMIDHIVLHREERVVPIEIRRSKLSRCLQGIVFRCHKCTFTSGSSENLRMHMTKHDDIKPYKCRLCYFDCTRLSDLEAHLSDKHQVVRNHELVGQVSLHQLQARVGTMPEQEEEPSSNFEQHNNDSEDVETDEFVTDCNEAPHKTQAKDPAENPTREDITLQTEEAGPKQWEDGKYKKSSAKSFVSVLQYENVKPNQEKHVQDPQERAVVFLLAQPKLRDNEDSSNTFRKQKDAEAEGSSTTCVKIAEKAQAPNPHDKASQHKRLDINAWVEENTLHHIHKTHMNADPDTRFKTEKNMETEVVDDVRSEMVLLDEEGSIPLAHEPEHLVNKEAISALSILLPKCAQLKLSHKESSAVSLPNCNNEQVYKKIAEVRDPYEDMPVLEKEYLKEEMQPLGCKEKDQSHHLEQKQDKEDEMITEDDENRCTNQKHEESDGRKEAANPLAPEAQVNKHQLSIKAAVSSHSPCINQQTCYFFCLYDTSNVRYNSQMM
ncbi:zinc finger protein 462-like isoform X2 [Cottoperca gobio]|uniref:Zinc finger protein 462-like isoform X2 n=1 Tax=Cottoperca gobio TaxID=56716 RepID=A0A6J2QAM2_COTGO|nr:zinc finger protein 462-like isoform X2 [Cottoperca gobio]